MVSAISLAARRGLDRHDVSDGIMSLTEKSLLRTDITGYKVRHSLLKATRAYLFGKLASSSDAALIYRWHAEVVLRTLHDAAMAWRATPSSEWIDEYGCAIEDARAAMTWACSEDGDASLGKEIAAALPPLAYRAVARPADERIGPGTGNVALTGV